MRKRLLARTSPQGAGLLFVGELHGDTLTPKMDHLVCFLPGETVPPTSLSAVILGKADPSLHVSLAQVASSLPKTCRPDAILHTPSLPHAKAGAVSCCLCRQT